MAETGLEMVGKKVVIEGELTLDLSFEIIAGDIGLVTFSAKVAEAKKEKKADEQVPAKPQENKEPEINANELPLEEITIPPDFLTTQPRKDKVDMAIKYYKEHGKFDKPVHVEKSENGWVLYDGYARFVAADQLKLEKIVVEKMEKIVVEEIVG